jgi:hypothetical protein
MNKGDSDYYCVGTDKFHCVQRLSTTYKLSDHERGAKENTGALNKGPATGTGDEDQSLTDDTDLEVQSSHQLMLAVPDRSDTKFVLRYDAQLRR